MSDPAVVSIDLLHLLEQNGLMGDLTGLNGRRTLRNKVRELPRGSLIHFDLRTVGLYDYKFLNACIFELLDEVSSDYAIVISCMVKDDDTVLRGAAWERGDTKPRPILECVPQIIKLGREFVLFVHPHDDNVPTIRYLGTDDSEEMMILTYLDEYGRASAPTLKSKLAIVTHRVTRHLDTLQRRRHVLMLDALEGVEPDYISVGRLFTEEKS